MTGRGGRSAVAERNGVSVSPALLATAALLLAAGIAAARYAWISDDAYISFRYAQNLIDGHGLVFNAGERVEGYSNFLWTLLTAGGMRLGVEPETWTMVLGIAAYLGTLVLLAGIRGGERTARPFVVPVAATGFAFMPDAWAFASSGLETSLFTFLAVASYVTLAGTVPSPRRGAVGGLLLALLSLTRPDGTLFAAVGVAYLAIGGRPRLRTSLACAGVLALMLGPYAAWKLAAYGDLLPNTYYAKSAALAWWDQGLAYLRLFLLRYWALIAALPLGVLAVAGSLRTSDDASHVRRRQVGLAMAFAAAYLLYVVRVGGDFMFARFAVPAVPFLLLLIQFGAEALAPGRALIPAAATLAGLLALWPSPLAGGAVVHGIIDERAYYLGRERATTGRMGELLRLYGAGLPIRLSFGGAQAVIAYRSGVPVAIESATGLTDRWIAHQPIRARGRVGHEKPAPWRYLIETRRANLLPGRSRVLDDTLSAYVPPLTLWLDEQPFTLLTWDPVLMDSLARRGAHVPDFEAGLEAFLADMNSLADSTVRAEYERLERFYFSGTSDARERRIQERLAGTTGAPARP